MLNKIKWWVDASARGKNEKINLIEHFNELKKRVKIDSNKLI